MSRKSNAPKAVKGTVRVTSDECENVYTNKCTQWRAVSTPPPTPTPPPPPPENFEIQNLHFERTFYTNSYKEPECRVN